MDEKDILYECCNGNKRLFNDLIIRYHEEFYKFCYFLCKNKFDANDLYQQTWLKVYEKIHTFDIKLSFKNWLYTIASNLFKDSLRKKKYIKTYDYDYELEDDRKYNDIKLDLERNILKLEDKLRIPLVLYYYEGFNIIEISKMLSVNIGTIKYRLKLAKEILNGEMEGDYYE